MTIFILFDVKFYRFFFPSLTRSQNEFLCLFHFYFIIHVSWFLFFWIEKHLWKIESFNCWCAYRRNNITWLFTKDWNTWKFNCILLNFFFFNLKTIEFKRQKKNVADVWTSLQMIGFDGPNSHWTIKRNPFWKITFSKFSTLQINKIFYFVFKKKNHHLFVHCIRIGSCGWYTFTSPPFQIDDWPI